MLHREDAAARAARIAAMAPNVPPIFHHLFALLPDYGQPFTGEQREAWLRAAAAVASIVYGPVPISLKEDR